ncbi:MAG TPA: glycosyltransferase, partial [Bacillota bacterium]|nr:glycosyltransferase [Bacillota bacterium]
QEFQVVHICGKGNVETSLEQPGYRQFEFIGPELPQVLAAADLCLSRAGANFIFELLALKKPTLLIPLSRAASRGDQILNARSFEKQGFSMVLEEEELTESLLLEQIHLLYREREKYIAAMDRSELKDAATAIIRQINQMAKNE